MISHPTLGTLIHDPSREAWVVFVRLPILIQKFPAASSLPAESVDEILEWLDNFRKKLAEPVEESFRTAQEEFDNWDDDMRPTRQDVRFRAWARWMEKLIQTRRAEGLLCVWLTSPAETPPAPIQERTIRHLVEQEAVIAGAIGAALNRSCRDYGCAPRQADEAHVVSITIHNEGLDEIAPVCFGIDCVWELEHGLSVVYHPRHGADWATADTEFDLIADSCPEPPPAPPPTPEEELVMAIITGDQTRMDELLAQGVRAEPSSGSALFGPIHEREVAQVRQLLAAGADPNRSDSYEGTPLQAARRALAEGTLTLPRRAPWWLKCIVWIPKLLNSSAIRRERRNGQEIVRLLLEAGAK